MERLFAPWRQAYVGATTPEPGCVLCRALGSANEALRNAIVLVQPTRSGATASTPLGPQDEPLVLAAAALSLIDGVALRHTQISVIVEWIAAE